jgi:FtsP/CotA-like multicopper oxidase with cupredoxin domain
MVLVLASAAAVFAIALPELNRVASTTSTTVKLPAGCEKPADGFLIIASELGYNDSVDHGVPQNAWPVMNVQQGQNVTIVVCNADPAQSHGFQIEHYYDAILAAIAPGQVLRVNFVADQRGTFRVYCSIPCSVHWAMQSGELIVA